MDEILIANSIYLEKDKGIIIKNLTFSVPRHSISVILDKPDSGIDAISLDKIKQLIINLRDGGTTILLITHREEIVEIADRAYLIGGGEIVKDGSPSEVVNFFKTECDKCFHRVIPEEFTKEV